METLKELAAVLKDVEWREVTPMTEAEFAADHDRRLADPRDAFYGFPCNCAEVCQKRAR